MNGHVLLYPQSSREQQIRGRQNCRLGEIICGEDYRTVLLYPQLRKAKLPTRRQLFAEKIIV
jgi:hypothetical protein